MRTKWGQNFLAHPPTMRRIADALTLLDAEFARTGDESLALTASVAIIVKPARFTSSSRRLLQAAASS